MLAAVSTGRTPTEARDVVEACTADRRAHVPQRHLQHTEVSVTRGGDENAIAQRALEKKVVAICKTLGISKCAPLSCYARMYPQDAELRLHVMQVMENDDARAAEACPGAVYNKFGGHMKLTIVVVPTDTTRSAKDCYAALIDGRYEGMFLGLDASQQLQRLSDCAQAVEERSDCRHIPAQGGGSRRRTGGAFPAGSRHADGRLPTARPVCRVREDQRQGGPPLQQGG